MTARAAWSEDQENTLLFQGLDTGSVRITHHHIDQLDADEDFSITVGEFRMKDLQRALWPVPLTQHAANQRPTLLASLLRGKKGRQK